METPSERLAELILERLVEQGLVLPRNTKRLLARLAKGEMNAQDWRLELEKATKHEEES